MNKRVLLKEIPSGKFHSVIFTTYSLDLYYLEQQVIPLLGAKGIHYISILSDSRTLSNQLAKYSSLSHQGKRSYSINGIQCNGAFHPKLIFLAGTNCVQLLLGSGNLTSSGHGKNLEVWNSVYIDKDDDPKLGFIHQVWNYIKSLHTDLGDSAQNKIKNIEVNCLLLNPDIKANLLQSYEINNSTSISFISPNQDISVFKQLSSIIGSHKIEKITVMCPFFDVEGKLIQELNKRYRPEQFNIILQESFGVAPYNMIPKQNMRFFDWNDVQIEEHRQDYFHAKNFIFEDKKRSYLLSGSANASIAAFGTTMEDGLNQEACILYESTSINYLKFLGLNIRKKTVKLKDYNNPNSSTVDQDNVNSYPVFIKAAEKKFDQVKIYIKAKNAIKDVKVRFYKISVNSYYEQRTIVSKGEGERCFTISNGSSLLYTEIISGNKVVSNKQFIIDVNAFEGTNPSPRNRSLNELRRIIESGKFLTLKIIDYINTIRMNVTLTESASSGTLIKERKDDIMPEEETGSLYLTYEQIQEKARSLSEVDKPENFIDYHGITLWDSIFQYLKETREKEVQATIDEEETEDLNSSKGRATEEVKTSPKVISRSVHQKLEDKVYRFLTNYDNSLGDKIGSMNLPTIRDLSMFLIMLEVIMHLLFHKEKILEGGKEEPLLDVRYCFSYASLSEFLLTIIGKFSLWAIKSNGIQLIDNNLLNAKLDQYKNEAFKTSICALSMFSLLNDAREVNKYSQWLDVSLLNVNKAFAKSDLLPINEEDFLDFFPKEARDKYGEPILKEEISKNLSLITSFVQKEVDVAQGDIYYQPNKGFYIIGRMNTSKVHKYQILLFNPGFEWDDDVVNYSNGEYVYID
jgi:hypothetical protein